MGKILKKHNSRTKRAKTVKLKLGNLKLQRQIESLQDEAAPATFLQQLDEPQNAAIPPALLQPLEEPQNATIPTRNPMDIGPVDIDPHRILQGRRIMDIRYVLNWAVWLRMAHFLSCGGILTITAEKRLGLSSKICFQCDKCPYKVWKSTEDPDNPVINKATVWGTISSGATYIKLRNFLGVLNIAGLCYDTYSKIEKSIYENLQSTVLTSMQSAAEKERELAISKNQIDSSGRPWIKTGLDGGWSKRSYGHSYNANSGTAVIVGMATKKILYFGTKNRFCLTCARAENKAQEPPQHKCFRPVFIVVSRETLDT